MRRLFLESYERDGTPTKLVHNKHGRDECLILQLSRLFVFVKLTLVICCSS